MPKYSNTTSAICIIGLDSRFFWCELSKQKSKRLNKIKFCFCNLGKLIFFLLEIYKMNSLLFLVDFMGKKLKQEYRCTASTKKLSRLEVTEAIKCPQESLTQLNALAVTQDNMWM